MGAPYLKLTALLTHVRLKPGEPLSCRRIAIPASSRRRGTQSVKRRCRAKYGSCYTLLIIRLKMIPYYFAHRSCGFGSPGDAALIFCFVLHQGKMKNKTAGALEKTNIKIQLLIGIIM